MKMKINYPDGSSEELEITEEQQVDTDEFLEQISAYGQKMADEINQAAKESGKTVREIFREMCDKGPKFVDHGDGGFSATMCFVPPPKDDVTQDDEQ